LQIFIGIDASWLQQVCLIIHALREIGYVMFWKKLKGMPQELAQKRYIKLVEGLQKGG